jgi:hypothetical protein
MLLPCCCCLLLAQLTCCRCYAAAAAAAAMLLLLLLLAAAAAKLPLLLPPPSPRSQLLFPPPPTSHTRALLYKYSSAPATQISQHLLKGCTSTPALHHGMPEIKLIAPPQLLGDWNRLADEDRKCTNAAALPHGFSK